MEKRSHAIERSQLYISASGDCPSTKSPTEQPPRAILASNAIDRGHTFTFIPNRSDGGALSFIWNILRPGCED
jgi:hypothetical protein